MRRECKRGTAIAAIGYMGAVVGCAVAPPSGPSVMALPPRGKSLTAFQQEDAQCRYHASATIRGTTQTGRAFVNAGEYDLQQHYDIAYTQCMYSRGDTVRAPPIDYAALAWPYPYPWYGPDFFATNFVVFGGSSFHHGFHHGGRH